MKNDAIKDVNLVGEGTVVEGKIRSQGSVRIDGKLVGDVNANESVAIGLHGEVEGNVSGKNVTVGGKVHGTITAAEKVVFEGKSIIRGDVRATRLVVDEGSIFDGKISMAEKTSGENRH
ncbi:MAG TPA: polymer-forming cytoskeletal protein [Bacteroidota bacterium]|nr:polymer-forming cytoskeletal protein [Bacteroidota bacterium]